MISDTIAAISTPPGEGAISVLRLSGPQAMSIAAGLFRAARPLTDLKPRMANLVKVMDAASATVDQGLLVLFRAPASYTGEDVVEFQGHGGVLVTQRVLEEALRAGARAAGPGEFTQRAFLNGKMDLTQAEAVMDLIHAHSTLAVRAANEQLEGAIGREAESMREELVPVLAHVEAYIDFPDEDISPDTGEQLGSRIDALIQRAERLLSTSEHGRILRHGARTVICGEPNVGKSSLLNALLGFERAIVSASAGTTRDTIEEFIQVHGTPLRLVDTAGLRESGDELERHGMARTAREIKRADLVLEVVDASQPPNKAQRVEVPAAVGSRHVLILNKADLEIHPGWASSSGVRVSCRTGEGLEELRDRIREILIGQGQMLSQHPIAINARHKACFERVRDRLLAARASLDRGEAPEFVALELREALQAIGEVVGQVDVEQILDVLFSSFCIGK